MTDSSSSHTAKAVILGATGPTGVHLARSLRKRGFSVRVSSRSLENLRRRFAQDQYELVTADAANPRAILTAVEGASHVFDCIGLPPDQMAQHPVTARHIAEAVQNTGARCMQVSSFWAYLPLRYTPLDEKHPREGGREWIRHRRAAEDILREAGAAIVQLPDFYGPLVHTSTLQQALQEAAAGKTMNWIGSPETKREYVFIPDAMEATAQLALRDEAYGDCWIVPGAGPISGIEVREIVARKLHREVKMRGSGMIMLRLVSVFSASLRGFLQMVPEYMKPIAYDGSKLRSLLGELPGRSYEESIGATLDWIREQPK